MVTFFLLMTMISMVALTSAVDMFYYNQPFLESINYVLSRQPGTGKMIVAVANFTGIIVAIGIDYRIWKNKHSPKQTEGNET